MTDNKKKDTSPLDQDGLLELIRKNFGDDIAFRIGEPGVVSNVIFLPTSIATLDVALGGGVPKGRVVEIYGPESSGKSAVACAIVGSLQRQGYPALYVDMEYALNLQEAVSNGMDIDAVTVSQPDTGEIAMSLIETVVRRSKDPMVIVFDSIASMALQAEIDADPGDNVIGLKARLMSQMMRKLVGPTKTGGHVLIFINQIRHKIGVMFGTPETTPGGLATKFAASVRIRTRKSGWIRPSEKADPIGQKCEARIDKNKVGAPFKTAKFNIMYDYAVGIDRVAATLEVAVDLGIVRKAGSNYYYPADAGTYFARSGAKAVEWLRENTDVYDNLYREVSTALTPSEIIQTQSE